MTRPRKRRSRRGRSCGFGQHDPRYSAKVGRLCRQAKRSQDAPAEHRRACTRLIEALSRFGHEDPASRIRARACGCSL